MKNYYPMMTVTREGRDRRHAGLDQHRAAGLGRDGLPRRATRPDRAPRPVRRSDGCSRPIPSATTGSTYCASTTRSSWATTTTRMRCRDKGYLATGLYATAIAAPAAGGKPTLCAHCHLSEALPGSGYAGIRPLTAAVHACHAGVIDPDQQHDDGQRDQPVGLLSLPPRIRNPVPARRDGQRGGGGRIDGDPVPELPRKDVRRRRADAHRLVERAHVPAVPLGDRDAQQRRHPVHVGLRRERPAAGGRRSQPSRPHPTRPRPACRCTGSRRAMAACSARPATARRTPSTPPRT